MPSFVIRVFNVKYSPNLGDGLLSECLEQTLSRHLGGADVQSLDLSGRTAWSFDNKLSLRPLLLGGLQHIPGPARIALLKKAHEVLTIPKVREHYRAGSQGATAFVIGGGNIVTDLDLNFPAKVSTALEVAAERAVPVFFYGVGVGSHFSATGQGMLRAGLDNVQVGGVFVRDEKSRSNWDRFFAGGNVPKAQVVRDPGLLVANVYKVEPVTRSQKQVLLGVISPVAINYHSPVRISAADLLTWFTRTALKLRDDGYEVVFFNNGSPEDRAFMTRLKALPELGGLGFVNCESVQGLCETIGKADIVVAHRMHALIASYAYGVPFVALNWDEKLVSFLDSVGLGHWLFRPEAQAPEDGVALIRQVLETGINKAEHARVLAEADDGIGWLAAALKRETLTDSIAS